jgi:hypothetical protein
VIAYLERIGREAELPALSLRRQAPMLWMYGAC